LTPGVPVMEAQLIAAASQGVVQLTSIDNSSTAVA